MNRVHGWMEWSQGRPRRLSRSAERVLARGGLIHLCIVALLLVGCTPGAAPAPAPPPPSPKAAGASPAPASPPNPKVAGAAPAGGPEWAELVGRATAEGRLSLVLPAGQSYREAIRAFEAAYPGVQVEVKGEHIRDAHPRILREREAGLYSADVMVGASGPPVYSDWVPRGVLDPLEPILLLPETRQDASWHGGFGDGWLDSGGKFVFGFGLNATQQAYVNRDVISEADLPELVKTEELLSPKLKGKLAWDDPRELGSGTQTAAFLLESVGDDYLKRLLREQEPVFTRDPRQLAEWVVRGTYPIGISVSVAQLKQFRDQGLGQNVKPVRFDLKSTPGGSGFGTVVAFNQAPHPNAAKLFINWLLSADGQRFYSQQTRENSRRTDVPAAEQETAPIAGTAYVNFQKEAYAAVRTRATSVVREVRP